MHTRRCEAPTESLLIRRVHGDPTDERRLHREELLGTIPEEVRRRHVLEVDVETLAEDFNLELEVELEFGELVELDEEAEDGHEPRVGRFEDPRLGALLEDLADEGDGDDEAVTVVALDEELLERDVLLLDRSILGERESSEPGSQVLEQRALRRGLDCLLRVEEGRELDVRLVEDALAEERHREGVEELVVQLVVVGLDADSLRNEVVGEPGEVGGVHALCHLADLGLKVVEREVVDDEEDLVRRLLIGRLVVLLSTPVDVDRSEGRTLDLLSLRLQRRQLLPHQQTLRRVNARLALLQCRASDVGDVGVQLLNVGDGEDGVGELGPFRESRLEPRERLDSKPEPVRVGRVAEGVEDVADRDTEGDEVDKLVLDEVSEETCGESELVGGVGVEEAVFVEESVEETGEELVVVRVVALLRSLESADNAVDRDLGLEHALVEGVALRLDLGREVDDCHARLVLRVAGREVHEARVELEALRSDFLEQLDVSASE